MDLENSKIKAPFTVPEAYFQELEDRLLSEVRISALSQLRQPPVPSNYFEDLEAHVLSTVSITPVQSFTPATPEDYFDTLESRILSRVKIDGLQQPAVEPGYFESLEDRIMAEVKLEGLKQPAVPAGYFDSLEKDILAGTVEKNRFRLFRNVKVFRGAAAAAVVGLLAYGFSLNYSPAPKDELANISSDAMIAYLSEQPLMEEDLNFVLDENDVFLTSEVSDKEITSYLMENGISI
ncbi:hypothetical protein [Leadbetterella sp. DM7]|uniref:hypothetical protein n=1 Tax=Leadbetterella sp. DM7 TaxID=3235085 RepID=UPI00349EEEF2